MRKNPLKIDHWTLFAVVVSFGLVSLLLPQVTRWCFQNLSQSLLWVLTLTTAAHLARKTYSVPTHALRYGLLTGVLTLAVIALSVEFGFRVLSDEANLVGISRQLLFDGEPAIPLQSRWSFDRFWTIETQLPKRPLLYPFLVSWLHRVSGYRIENAFATNLMILFALVTFIFTLASRWKGTLGGVTAVLFVIAQPIIALTATSAGYDLLAASLFLISLVLTSRYFKRPDPENLADLVLGLLWLSHVRYEGILLIPFVAFFVWRDKSFSNSWLERHQGLVVLVPLLLLPRLWQHALTWGVQGQFSPLGLSFVWQNGVDLITGIFTHNETLPYAQWLSWMALASFSLALTLPSSRSLIHYHFKKSYVWVPLALFSVDQIVRFLVSGVSYLDPNTFRLFISLQIAMGFLLFYSLHVLRTPSNVIVLVGVFFWVTYHPRAVENRSYRSMDSLFETKLVHEFLDTIPNQRVLLITDRPGNYTIREVGAVDFAFANKNLSPLVQELSDHLYDNIYVVQRIPFATQASVATTLGDSVTLEPVFEHQTTLKHFLRISRFEIHSPAAGSAPNLTQKTVKERNEPKSPS